MTTESSRTRERAAEPSTSEPACELSTETAAPGELSSACQEDDTEAESTTTTVMPARVWPQYNVDRARAEIIAMELLTKGMSTYRVKHVTRLSSRAVRRLANLVAEEAKNPVLPRNVCRHPIPMQAAQQATQKSGVATGPAVRGVPQPAKRAALRPVRGASQRGQRVTIQPARRAPLPAPVEPEQLTLSIA